MAVLMSVGRISVIVPRVWNVSTVSLCQEISPSIRDIWISVIC